MIQMMTKKAVISSVSIKHLQGTELPLLLIIFLDFKNHNDAYIFM
jgi:hypothetical protein